MTDKMFPVPMRELTRWIVEELDSNGSVFGLPVEMFFNARSTDPFSTHHAGIFLETPVGVAAGPHTQLAHNIVSAYLMGARFIELKTVQPLDTIEVNKPCIDMQDLGYNCEWSQELRLNQSRDEYIKAWILVRLLREKLGLNSGPEDGFAFNMSVGYDLAGIKGKKVREFIGVMKDSSGYLEMFLEQASSVYPAILDIHVPRRISSSVTLSTMHGCPPDEIERIGLHLIGELGLDTAIKLNPTLLGPEQLREILNGELGFDDVQVPDAAFEHDPGFSDALDIIASLRAAAKRSGVHFWIKLTNTLETTNLRKVLPAEEKVHYMSGRALHPLAVQLASNLQDQFQGQLDISLSGGADAFNLPELIAGGLNPVTVCSDLLRPGGYGRLAQYMDNLSSRMASLGAADDMDFVWSYARDKRLVKGLSSQVRGRVATLFGDSVMKKLWPVVKHSIESDDGGLRGNLVGGLEKLGIDPSQVKSVAQQIKRCIQQRNLAQYAKAVRKNEQYKSPRRTESTKTARSLGTFDCIWAPCRDRCPTSQDVPTYMYLVANQRVNDAMEVVLRDNPLPYVTGTVCDHTCTYKCVRTNYDQALDIRGIKGYIAKNATRPKPQNSRKIANGKVAVIGAGPAGLSAAYFLTRTGFDVVCMEASQTAGGVPREIIPEFRLPSEVLTGDIEFLRGAGVKFEFGVELGRDKSLDELRNAFDYVFLGLGALDGLELGIEGQESLGVVDCLDFLEKLKDGHELGHGQSVVVVGGGNSAMDAARAAVRSIGRSGKVTVVYRRTQRQMPADDEEILGAEDDGVEIMELTQPVGVKHELGRLVGLSCVKMSLGETDSSGRPKPIPVRGSEFFLPADLVVVAIGQRPRNALLSSYGLELDSRGRLLVDENTGETNLEGVFAGGDVTRAGSSIIQAVADAKVASEQIIRLCGKQGSTERRFSLDDKVTEREHLVRRMMRKFKPVASTPMTSEQARKEAGRCLGCDEYCSICVTVCPNRANLTYRVDPVKFRLPTLKMTDGKLKEIERTPFMVTQGLQVLNMADLCNECGNCETFCPTSGAPYKDKPRLCFSDDSFAGQKQAYRFSIRQHGWKMEYADFGHVHVLQNVLGKLRYSSEYIDAELNEDLNLISYRPKARIKESMVVELNTCASMYVLARSLAEHSVFLPLSMEPA